MTVAAAGGTKEPIVKDTETLARELGLKPMQPMRLRAGYTASDMLRQMANTAFTGRQLGEAADVMEAMLRDPDCRVVMTLSGAMTMAGLSRLIMEAIGRGWIQVLVATGALVGHGMVEDLGLPHYKADPSISDDQYFDMRLNRVYDTLEPEQNLNELEHRVRDLLFALAKERNQEPVGTAELLGHLGRNLPGDGILQAAARSGVTVIIPAFTDSELGLDVAVNQTFCRRQGLPPLRYDAFRDLELFREFCLETVSSGKKLGIFTVGGGVPRNWAQQVGPFVDVCNTRLGTSYPTVRFTYAVRICPDPVHYGHLSGCTYSEGVSWGKFVPHAEGGAFAEVLLDATVGWPLLTQAMIDRGL